MGQVGQRRKGRVLGRYKQKISQAFNSSDLKHTIMHINNILVLYNVINITLVITITIVDHVTV